MISAKNVFIVFLILILDSSLFYCQLLGASFNKAENGYSTSISFGDTRQFSDVPSSIGGWGTNFSLGKNLYYSEYSTFAFDLLGNLSYLVSKGLDTDARISPFNNSVLKKTDYEYFYYNHKTSLFAIGIDGKMTFNKFRKDQNWYLALSLGGNWGIFSTKMDIFDDTGNDYFSEFTKIKNDSKSDKKKALRKILDGKYETKAEGFEEHSLKSRLMPSLGLEVGFDITDYLSVFLADKLYFTNTNSLDGEVHLDDESDLLNFAGIGFNIYFNNGKNADYIPVRKRTRTFPDNNGYEIPQEVEDHNFPEVKIIEPEHRPYKSYTRKLRIKAKINNINSALGIKCKVNGKEVPFDYNSKFVHFTAELEPGDNKIQIYGENDFGQSRDVISVYFQGGRQEITEPEIQLIAPTDNVYYSEKDVYTIKARIHYIESENDIQVLANGYPFKSYRFDKKTSEFKLTVRLAEGQNSFEIIAKNEEGKAISSFDIYYKLKPPTDSERNKEMPEITIINPTSKTSNLGETDLLDFEAKISGITDKNAITFTVNERKNKYFDFNVNTGILKDKISLFDDVTTIRIIAKNDFGTATKDVTVYMGQNPAPKKKHNEIINFVNVSIPDSDCKVNIEVNIKGANSKKHLKLFLNQFEIRNFLFNNSSIKSSLYLDEGANVIKVVYDDQGTERIGTYNISCDLNGENGDNGDNGNNQDNENSTEIKNEPFIDISYPQSNSTLESEILNFRASIKYVESKYDIKLKFNGESISDFNFDEETGEVFTELILIEGENTIYIEASNNYGEASKKLMFTYEEPLKGPPSVMINSPRNGFKTDKNSVVFRATIENVKSTETIYVTLNGRDFTNFKYDEERGIIFTNLPLSLGKNTLRVEAENRLGSDFDEVTFQYRAEVVPAVKITSPKSGIIMGVAYTPIKAIVQNITKKTEAMIYVNGKKFRSFTINNEMLSSKVIIQNGENEIVVKAANDYGIASDTIIVNFNGKPQKPTIEITHPRKSGMTVHDRNYEFEAKVDGIRHSSYANITLNNRTIDNVHYYKDEKIVKVKLKLRKGWNYIKLTATNKTGSSIESTKIFLQ